MDQHGSGADVRGHRLAAAITPLVIAVLAVAGCASNGGATSTSPIATASPATTAPPTTTAQVRPECAAVAAAARNLGDQFAALANGQASRDQVKAAAEELRSTLDAARGVIKPESQADVDAASTAIQQLETTLNTQPIDLAAVRAATQQALEAVGQVLIVCAPGTPPPSVTLPPVPASPVPTS